MKALYMLIGSILAALLVLKMLSGEKYRYLVENLDSKEYPVSGMYVIGFAWSETSLLSLKGKMRETLVGQARLLYDPKFAEYYASVIWAQTISFVHVCLAIGFVFAGTLNSGFMAFFGILSAGIMGYYSINRMNDLLKEREIKCTAELPEIVSTMALLINAGMMLRNVWRLIADSKEGVVYDLMRQSCNDMENGMSEIDAIHKFGRMSNSADIRKFTSALAQSLERGGAELSDFLGRQSIEMLTLKKQLMLQKGEEAASKLLAPTALLFVGIIIAVMTGALGMLI